MSITNTDSEFLQKTAFGDGFDPDSMVKGKPASELIPHDTDFATGRGMEQPAAYAGAPGVSAQITVAVANAGKAKGVLFTIDQKHTYAHFAMDHSLVQNAKEGKGTDQFVDQFKYHMEHVVDGMGWELERMVFGSSAGYRGKILTSSIGSDSSFTLEKPTDILHFYVGLVFTLGTTATGAIRTGGTTNKATVTGIDPALNTVYCAGQNLTTLFGAVSTDYIFAEGDAQNGAGAPLCPYGLPDWNPLTAPSATLFCNVDRTPDPVRLAGHRYDGSGDSIESAFINARASYHVQLGKPMPDGVWLINPLVGAAMRNHYESKRILSTKRETTYDYSVNTFTIDGNEFVEAAACPYTEARFMGDGAFVRASSGDQPSWMDDRFFSDPNTGTVKGTLVHYGNHVAKRVNELSVLKMSTAVRKRRRSAKSAADRRNRALVRNAVNLPGVSPSM